jgi:phage-related tail fiber protein
MARKFGTDIDLMGFALLKAKANPVSSDPAGLGVADEGQFWYNTTTDKFKVWTGTAVIDLTDLANSSGSLTASRISDFTTAVQALRWSSMLGPNADVAMGGFKITGLADGVAGSDAASYGQVLALINNQVFKAPVRAATTAAITLSGTQTVDGVSLIANDRVLVKDQASGATNGIYTVQAGAWVRATDADASSELPPGAIISVQEGTANGDKLFLLATNGPITLGTTALVFSAYGASTGEIGVAGAGLTKTGTTYDVVAGSTGTVTVAADAVDVNVSRVPRRWNGVVPTASATVDGLPITISGAQVTFNHAANNTAPLVVIRAGSSPVSGYTAGEIVEHTDGTTDANNVRITLPAAPASNNWVFGVYA